MSRRVLNQEDSSTLTRSSSEFARFRRIYTSIALLLANSVFFVLILNLALIPFFFIRDFNASGNTRKTPASTSQGLFNKDGSPVDNGKRSPYQLGWIDFNAYEGLEPAHVAAMLDDFTELAKHGFMYQPWVEFSEPPFNSKQVNVDVDERGFPIRRTVNPPNGQGLPTVRILALGGSTTFGYNVSDQHTWPSYLSKILNERATQEGIPIHIEVVNYGRGYYNTSQETVLFIDLLKSGQRPSLAIFMDGLNWPYSEDVSNFTDLLRRQFMSSQFGSDKSFWDRFEWIPVVRLANALNRRLFPAAPAPGGVQDSDSNPPYDLIINRFNENRRIAIETSRIHSVAPLFFTQPNAIYNYPFELYRLKVPDSFNDRRKRTEIFYSKMRMREGTTYLGDLFESFGRNRKAIVDDVHYSPAFNEFLASHVAANIELRKLATRPAVFDGAASTGLPRTSVPNY